MIELQRVPHPTPGRLARTLLGAAVVWASAATPAVAPQAAGSPRSAATADADAADASTASTGNLPFFYDLYTFRGAGGATDVVAAFAVRAGNLSPKRRGAGILYGFDVSLVLADTATRAVSRTDDSAFVSLPRPLGDDHLLYTHIDVRTAPSPHTVQRVIMNEGTTPGVGQLYHSPFPIPDYRGSRLMLSDIALGQPAAVGSGWRRGDITLALLPTSQFPASSFDVYYEIYNLPHGRPYTTEITVRPIGARGRVRPEQPVGLRFAGEAAQWSDGSVRELRRVDAALPRGAYRLEVVVTDLEAGTTARRSRDFHVRGWRPGTTLVPAYPRRSQAG